jgi:hypothetical protein
MAYEILFFKLTYKYLIFFKTLSNIIDIILLIFWFWTGAHYVAQAGLKVIVLLPWPPETWDYSHVSPESYVSQV